MVLVEFVGLGLAYLGVVWTIGLVRAEDLAQFRRRAD
jgi:hypothetical protein